MKPVSSSRISQAVGRIQTIWSELVYAQRRMFAIRTGIDLDEVERAQLRARLTPHGR